MKKTIHTTPSTLDEYISHIYTLSHSEESVDTFTTKAMAISHALPKRFWTLPSDSLFTTLLDKVKSGKIDITDINYVAHSNTILDGFRSYMLSTMDSDMSTLKGRVKRSKPSITFDDLDSIVVGQLPIEM